MVTGRIGRRIGIGPAFLVGCIVFPAPLVLVPLAEGPQWLILTLLFLAEFGSGLGVMMLDISAGAIFAALIPNRLRSRVSGAYSAVNYGVRPLGSLVGGALGTTIGLRPTLWIAHRRRARRGALATPLADSPAARPAGAGRRRTGPSSAIRVPEQGRVAGSKIARYRTPSSRAEHGSSRSRLIVSSAARGAVVE